MFATDLRFLNDREEFIHTRELAKEIVGGAPELDADGFQNRKFLARAVSLAFESGPLIRSQVFVASFTAAEDQLGQWRGYSHGSSGVSLAFDPGSFRPPADIGTLALFAPCVYDPLKKKELLLNALHHFKEQVSGYHKEIFRAACEANPEKFTSNKEEVVREFLEANPSKKANFESRGR